MNDDTTFEVQTRSHHLTHMLEQHPSFQAAYHAFQKDHAIWKLSWSDPATGKDLRFRVKTRQERWSEPSEEKLGQLCPSYRFATPSEVFWINQTLIAPNYDALKEQLLAGEITEKRYEILIAMDCNVEILTDEQFRARYNITKE